MMRKLISSIFAAVCIYLIAAGVYAQTCTVDDSPGQDVFEKLMPKKCLPGESGSTGKDTGTLMDNRNEALENSGVSRITLHHMQIISQSPIYLDGPSAIIAQQDLLELNAQQKERLMDLLGEMRVKANEILTPRQRARLEDVPNQPISIDQVCRQMREQVARAKNGNGNGGSRFQCPVCPMMQEKAAEPTTKPTKD